MSGLPLLAYSLLWATLVRGLLVRASILPATCARCGLHFERRSLGERICGCSRGD